MQWTRSNKTPGSRVLGLQIMNQMVYNSTLDAPEGPIFKSFKTCPEFNRVIPNLQRDKNKPEDVDTKGEDHCWDSIRYSLLFVRDSMQTKSVSGL